jgi:cell division protein FtsI/penicillin-binding protein 2
MLKVVVDPGGKVELSKARAPERVLSQRTCDRLKADLENVVLEGTGKAAKVPHRRVAGKTGTAQKPTPGAGYNSGKYIGSFVGFAPVDSPKVAILVAIDEPRGSHYGGVVAAPAFSEICEGALAYMRVPPDSIAPDTRIASVAGAAE